MLDFLLEYYCDTEQRGLNRLLFIKRGHFTGYFLRGSAGMPHRFLEAKQEGSSTLDGAEAKTCKGRACGSLMGNKFRVSGQACLGNLQLVNFGQSWVKKGAFGHFS